MQVIDVVRRFSKTPLKHRMSKYLLEYLLESEELLNRIKIVATRAALPDTMVVAQAGADGPSFELELGAVEREEVSLVNGRLVKQTRRNRALWVHDPVQAVEVLRTFKGVLHVQFSFAGASPDWYNKVAEASYSSRELQSEFAQVIREQIELAISGILLKHEIEEALKTGDRNRFMKNVKPYKQIRNSCLWKF